nr:ribosylnicotinamide kinase [Polyrhizophydium stewartii]
MSPRVLLVGVGGASCSGKSTLTNWLAKIFDCKVVHQDKFYLPDSEIPMVNGVADWDCPEAIDTRRFVETLRDAKLAQSGFQSELGDNRPKLDESEVAPQILANLCASAAAAKSLAGCEVVLVDGFLLFQDPRVYLEFGAAFFLRASFETLLARRNARERYITAEGVIECWRESRMPDADAPVAGYWEDPPGYFEEFVYPAYLRNNKLILDGKLAQQHADLHASLTILDTDATTIEDNVVRAVARLCELMGVPKAAASN